MTTKPPMYVLHAPGTNRDQEAAWAGEEAGFNASIEHVADLIDGRAKLENAAALVVPGGFSYGDALGAGVRLALDLRLELAEVLKSFVASGGLVLGICNGFQTLVKAGLLPGVDPARESASAPSVGLTERRVTLTRNENGRFECRWVHLEVNTGARAGWLSGIDDLIHCPVAHGEGRFMVDDPSVATGLETAGLVAFRYVDADGRPLEGRYPLNPNGSVADIAGICDHTGQVVGLMPHPEDHIRHLQRPFGPPGQSGLALFEAMRGAVQ